MNRGSSVFFAALMASTALPSSGAFAQYYSQSFSPPSAGYRNVANETPARAYPPGYWLDEDDDVMPPPRPRYPRYSQGTAQQGPSVIEAQPDGSADGRLPAPGYQLDDITPRPPGQVGPGQVPSSQAVAPVQGARAPGPVAGLPPEDQPEVGAPKELPPNLRKQLVDYPTKEPAGTLIVDTPNTYLYLVLGNGKAMRYGIGVGREGFTWTGAERVSRMSEWPDWHPPSEMIERQPYLPRFMAGGDGNPLGARALYLGKTLYRIHGTNQPSTIGTFVSSGCIRLINRDIEDLYSRVQVGTKVVVLPGGNKAPMTAANTPVGSQPVSSAPASGAPLNTIPNSSTKSAISSSGAVAQSGDPLLAGAPPPASIGDGSAQPSAATPAGSSSSAGGSITSSPLPPAR